MRSLLLRSLTVVGVFAGAACARAPDTRLLRWGGDAEGGAPFVEADAANPDSVRGFDVEVAALLATGIGRTPRFTQVAWASIEQSVARGDFDVGMSGVEDRAELRRRFAVTTPYYQFREVLAVRRADSARFLTLRDLRGKRVATLGNTQAYRLLVDSQAALGVVPVSYDDDVHPYGDLVDGRVDAVLLDHVIAERALQRTPGFRIQPAAVDTGYYVAVLSADNTLLRDSLDAVLRARMADGSLERIFRRWGVWDEAQRRFFVRTLASAPSRNAVLPLRTTTSLLTYLPAFARAAWLTIAISVLSMLLAMSCGMLIAAGRVYGARTIRVPLAIYVEVVRGTPVLLQLFVIYYGLSSAVRLPAFLAAVIGLGLNYAAYEAEVYRAALEAIPRPQLEAARTLGLSEWQVFRYVRAPQAVRFALAPMTNDFVALLKDSSLVSVITVVELTKQTAIYATNVGSWFVPGVLCAVLYLAMSLPLSHLARRLEARWSVS